MSLINKTMFSLLLIFTLAFPVTNEVLALGQPPIPDNRPSFALFDSTLTIVATNETGTSDSSLPNGGSSNVPVAIGEKVTYRAITELAESTTISLRLDDVLPDRIDFVPGSARVSYLADTLPSLFGDFAGIQNESSPSLPFPAGRINFNGGTRTLSFDFGTVINNDGDGDAEYFIIEFDAVVVDNVVNASGDILQNDFNTVADEGFPTEITKTSNQVGVIIVEPSLSITKTFTPNQQVRGENVTMTLVVDNLSTNGATAPIFDLKVTDTLDDWLNITAVNVNFNAAAVSFGSSHTDNSTITPGFSSGVTDKLSVSISGLPVGGVATIEVTSQIDPTADPLLLSRTITNSADVTGDSLASDITPDDEDRAYTDNAIDDLDVVKPTLLVTKTDSVDPVAAGDSMNYTITIQNTGTPNFAATNVIFTDQLPTGFNVTLVTPSQGTCAPVSGGTFTCLLGTIASGASTNVVITGSYPATTASGTIANNIAYASSTEGNNGNDGNDTPTDSDDERAEEPTTILRQSDVTLVKTVNDAEPVEGQTIRYTLAVGNSGPSQATNVVVTDSLPTGVTFVEFLPATLPCVYAAPTLTCTVPVLNVTEERAITIRATVDAGTLGSTITNTASVTSTEPDANLANNSDDTDIKVVTDNTPPTVTVNSLVASYVTGPISFKIAFSEELENFGGGSGADDVTNIINYLLVENGNNNASDTVSCGPVPGLGGVKADDSQVPVNSVTYDSSTYTVTVSINGNKPLPGGKYRLFVCGTTSIVDLAHNELNGGTDYIFDFTVLSNTTGVTRVKTSSLPKTGFAPNRITSLPLQPDNFKYKKLGAIWIEIPGLGVDSEIVGVPISSAGAWDVTWLGNSTGWLNGTAFPTWEGNSVLTAHVTNANGLAGPFSNIKSLKYGDRVIVHMGGQQYFYEVRDTQLVRPYLTSFAFQDLEGYSYLTLITCAAYNVDTEEYAFRRVVRAVLVEVETASD